MGLIEQAEERHAAVRALVEREHPHCRVQNIEERTRSEYRERRERGAGERMIGTDEWVLLVRDIAYEVEAVSLAIGTPSVKVRILVVEPGELRIADTTFTMGYAG